MAPRFSDDQVSHPHRAGHRPRGASGTLAFGPRVRIARENRYLIARRRLDLARVNLSFATNRLFNPFLNVGGRGCGRHFDQIGNCLYTSDALHCFFSGYFLKIPLHCPFECEQPILYGHRNFAPQKMSVAFQKGNSVLFPQDQLPVQSPVERLRRHATSCRSCGQSELSLSDLPFFPFVRKSKPSHMPDKMASKSSLHRTD